MTDTGEAEATVSGSASEQRADTQSAEPTFTMPLSLAQAIVDYLQQRPYAEVAGIITALVGVPTNGNGAVPDEES